MAAILKSPKTNKYWIIGILWVIGLSGQLGNTTIHETQNQEAISTLTNHFWTVVVSDTLPVRSDRVVIEKSIDFGQRIHFRAEE